MYGLIRMLYAVCKRSVEKQKFTNVSQQQQQSQKAAKKIVRSSSVRCVSMWYVQQTNKMNNTSNKMNIKVQKHQ